MPPSWLADPDPEQHVAACGLARLNWDEGLIVQLALQAKLKPSILAEAKALTLLRRGPHVQQIAGICPEQLSLATKHGGPALKRHVRRVPSLESRVWNATQRDFLSTFHAEGIARCDLSADCIGVDRSQQDPKVNMAARMSTSSISNRFSSTCSPAAAWPLRSRTASSCSARDRPQATSARCDVGGGG